MRAILVFALVALVFAIRDIGLTTLGRYLRRIGWWWLAVVPMEALCTLLDATAMRAFTSPEKHKVPLRAALLAQLAGRAVNAVTPSGNLGEVVKISVLTEKVSQSRAVSTILLYNVVSFCGELLIIATAVPFLLLLVSMPGSAQAILGITCGVCLTIAFGLYFLVHRGMVASFAQIAVRLRHPLAPEKARALYARWQDRVNGVDDKMRLVAGASRRDRIIGIVALTCARLNSMALSLMILHAVGEPITMPFVTAWVVGSFAIYFASTIVPMGIGVAESGYWSFYRLLGENPARGVTLVVARRTVTILYAAIGLVLVTTSETVKRAKQRHMEKAAEPAPLPRATATQVPMTPVPLPADDRP
jgi:hypothetical protein